MILTTMVETAQDQSSVNKKKPNVSISEIDLSQVSIQELMTLKARVDEQLAAASNIRLGNNDVVIEYAIKARAHGDVVHEAEGTLRLNAVLHPRLLPTAPMKLESMFVQQIMEPLNADLGAIFDGVQPEKPSLTTIKTTPPSLNYTPNNTYAAAEV